MKILFVGSKKEYLSEIETKGEGSKKLFSLSFCNSIIENTYEDFDILLIPANKLIQSPIPFQSIPIIASGDYRVARFCFDSGCCDFLRSPWNEEELYARAKARIHEQIFISDRLTIDRNGKILGSDSILKLNSKDIKILRLLSLNKGKVVPKTAIAALLGNLEEDSRAIDMRISRIRKKLMEAGFAEESKNILSEKSMYFLI